MLSQSLRDNGNPPAEFQVDASWFSVTIRARTGAVP